MEREKERKKWSFRLTFFCESFRCKLWVGTSEVIVLKREVESVCWVVFKRERERERKTDRERERERELI